MIVSLNVFDDANNPLLIERVTRISHLVKSYTRQIIESRYADTHIEISNLNTRESIFSRIIITDPATANVTALQATAE